MDIEKTKQMVQQFPDDGLMQFTLGQKYYDHDDLTNAKHHLEKAHELEPNHLLTHLLLGNIYLSLADDNKAKTILERGLNLMPTLPAGQGQDLEPEFRAVLEELEEDDF